MKNTALVLTGSTIAAQFVLMGLFLVYPPIISEFIIVFWADYFLLSWILLGINCAIAVLAFILASRERMRISYGLSAASGAILGILLSVLIFMVMIYGMGGPY